MSANGIFKEGAYLGKKKVKTEELIKGDKLRDLILLVHLNNKYGKGKNEIPTLKEILNYSTGGIYSALDSSGYFERTNDGVILTKEGQEYIDKKILPRYSILKSVGDILIFLGIISIIQWILWNWYQYAWIPSWYSGLSPLAGGLVLRFFGLRLHYWLIKRRKEIPNL